MLACAWLGSVVCSIPQVGNQQQFSTTEIEIYFNLRTIFNGCYLNKLFSTSERYLIVSPISGRPFSSIWRSIPPSPATFSASSSTRSGATLMRSCIRRPPCAACTPFRWSCSSTATEPFTWRSIGRASASSRTWSPSDSGVPTTTCSAGPRSARSKWPSRLWLCSSSAGLRTTPSPCGTGWTSTPRARSTHCCARRCSSSPRPTHVWIHWSTDSTTFAGEWTTTIR